MRITLGIVFVLLGIVGILIPVMPQLLFFAAAALMLAPDFPPARRAIDRVFRKWPKLRQKIPKRIRKMAKQDLS